ncbi:SixA phosphatase family protein [Aestuariirhabdus litorea]|uniref:Histidine phosphatase family protein n=1 Tax=Aestuariirhabdus litorea TaxID=2528527 RepID=A0A3P3VQ82_9GAMM|nr:histidine phosphatase family protein [Aestuariirhabdus litorea]RRJ84932.1 histidine phosphatase family protein [Aestuariirhabdus litorea]RWW98157.1 histidine phosphatase family protein [Endozoicomonadaceae bacterium GTF-13]
MKQLLILRHAKSSWSHPELSDFDRPLNARGQRTAPKMAALVHEHFPDLSLILSSPARRAKETAQAVARRFGGQPHLELEPDLYHADALQIRHCLAGCDERHPCVMLVGHNPGLEECISELDGDFCDPLPTAGLVVLECAIEQWRELGDEDSGRGSVHVTALYLPRQQFPDL